MDNSTQVPVLIENIKIGATRCLQEIEAQRQALFEKEVQKAMRTFNRPLGFLIGISVTRTREEAEKYVRDNAMGLEYWQILGWGQEARASKLLSAIKISAEDVIYLGLNDASLVEKYLSNEK